MVLQVAASALPPDDRGAPPPVRVMEPRTFGSTAAAGFVCLCCCCCCCFFATPDSSASLALAASSFFRCFSRALSLNWHQQEHPSAQKGNDQTTRNQHACMRPGVQCCGRARLEQAAGTGIGTGNGIVCVAPELSQDRLRWGQNQPASWPALSAWEAAQKKSESVNALLAVVRSLPAT